MKIIERNLQEIGSSLLVSVPKEWTKSLKLKKGSKVKLMVSERGALLISPEFTKDEKPKETHINYDKNFRRKFYRAYFYGYETIDILLKEQNKNELGTVHEVLKRFMNVQIIEDVNNKITVKCFKIEELSIEECLKRMFYLSKNMLDEVNSKEGNNLIELEASLTKFYYMLVMQVRRFIDEGKYTQENQIPLVRSMDCRMVAEKIERIGDIAKEIKQIKNPELKKVYDEIILFYNSVFLCFINQDYEKSLQLSQDLINQKRKYEKMVEINEKNIILYKQADKTLQLFEYAKEILMIVR